MLCLNYGLFCLKLHEKAAFIERLDLHIRIYARKGLIETKKDS